MSTRSFDVSLKSKLIDTFRFTANFLNEHNLTWWAFYGTAIGAVRHKNIIPWDDDIDIVMPRESFNRLIQLKNELKGSDYKLICMGEDDLFTSESKIVLRESSWQEREYLHCNTGIYIDIFPLDSINVDYKSALKINKKIRWAEQKYFYSVVRPSIKSIVKSFIEKKYTDVRVMLIGVFFPYSNRKRYLESYKQIVNQYFSMPDGEFYAFFGARNFSRNYFKKEWFEETIEIPFADFMVKIPKDYDAILSTTYGDYMQLPPEEKRVSHHEQYYVSLSRRLSKETIDKKVMDNITKEL